MAPPGHVFATGCKPGLPGRGVELLAQVCQASPLPVYAIGGVGPGNIAASAAGRGRRGLCDERPYDVPPTRPAWWAN